MDLTSRVQFLGYVNDADFPKLYRSAIALVHPSLMEGFSLTGLEAMTLHCPVISSSASCLPEIHGQAALYFDPNNSSQLVKQIKTLQKSKTLRQKLITLGHQQVAKYSWSKTALQTLDVYQKTLNS